jgi:hypothetical protein
LWIGLLATKGQIPCLKPAGRLFYNFQKRYEFSSLKTMLPVQIQLRRCCRP